MIIKMIINKCISIEWNECVKLICTYIGTYGAAKPNAGNVLVRTFEDLSDIVELQNNRICKKTFRQNIQAKIPNIILICTKMHTFFSRI